jgi:hypothetical protein
MSIIDEEFPFQPKHLTKPSEKLARKILRLISYICKRYNMQISACSCQDSCDAISISIDTKDGVIRIDHFGANQHGQLTDGNAWRVKTEDEIIQGSWETKTEPKRGK